MPNTYDRYMNESRFDYGMRLISLKIEQKPSDLDWEDIVELTDLNIHRDTLRKASQTEFGGYNVYKVMKNKLAEAQCNNDKSELRHLRSKIGEFDIKKRQLQIERNGLNKLKRNLIPSISVADEIAQFMVDSNMEINIPEYMFTPIDEIESEYEMIVQLSDLHIGYVIDNCKGNYFNWEVANKRIDRFIDEINKNVKLYGINKIYVVGTGDFIEHSYMRKNQSQFCEFAQSEQINKAIEIIYRFLVALCGMDCNVVYTSIAGNHDRSGGDAKANLKGDNADVIIARQIKKYNEIASLGEKTRLTVIENDPFEDEVFLEINGTKHKFIHGDGKFKNGDKLIKSEMSMDDDSYTLWRGHYHNFNVTSENNGRYIITSGCLSGYNDYSRGFGCQTSASQTIGIIGDGAIEVIKDIQLQ